jgi:hypothetical protein
MSSIQNITKTPTPEVAGQLLKVANDSALVYARDSFDVFRIDTSLLEDHLGAVSLIYIKLRP